MAEDTKIGWCDATFNPWIGCTKVSDGCKFCYAERDFDHRYKKAVWGKNGTRVLTSAANWQRPIRWNREVPHRKARPYRVFCASLCDIFEDWQGEIKNHHGDTMMICPNGHIDGSVWDVTPQSIECSNECGADMRPMTMNDVRGRLFRLIDQTPELTWILLTKRPENIERMMRDVESQKRGACCECGQSGRNRDGQLRPVLESGEKVWQSVDRRIGFEPMQKSESRVANRSGVSANSYSVGWEKISCGCTQAGVVSGQGRHSRHDDHQSQEWSQGRQSDREFGTGDHERAKASCSQCFECEQKSPERIEASENKANGAGCSNDSASQGAGGVCEAYCCRLRNEGKGSKCDCKSANMEACLAYRPNLWLGTSIENQETANERVPHLLKCKPLVSKLFLSAEPLLGPIDLASAHRTKGMLPGWPEPCRVDWVIAGCESGPQRRPMQLDWCESMLSACKEKGIAFFMKQMEVEGKVETDVTKFPDSLRVQEFPK